MRTSILLSGILISKAINENIVSGMAGFLAGLIIAAMVMDLSEFIKKISK